MRYIVFVFIIALVASCSDKSPAIPEAEGIDLTGFQIFDIPGQSAQRVIRYDQNGRLLRQGLIKNGKKEGVWTEYHPGINVPKTIESYLSGVKNGPSFTYDDRGQLISITGYLNNEFHGVKANYKYGKAIEEATYVNGKLDGVYRTYHEGRNRGKIQKEIEYKMGQQHGMYRFYNEQGDMTLEYEYRNGEKISGGMVGEQNKDSEN